MNLNKRKAGASDAPASGALLRHNICKHEAAWISMFHHTVTAIFIAPGVARDDDWVAPLINTADHAYVPAATAAHYCDSTDHWAGHPCPIMRIGQRIVAASAVAGLPQNHIDKSAAPHMRPTGWIGPDILPGLAHQVLRLRGGSGTQCQRTNQG
jgi:hypothetical protein